MRYKLPEISITQQFLTVGILAKKCFIIISKLLIMPCCGFKTVTYVMEN